MHRETRRGRAKRRAVPRHGGVEESASTWGKEGGSRGRATDQLRGKGGLELGGNGATEPLGKGATVGKGAAELGNGATEPLRKGGRERLWVGELRASL